MTKDVFIYALVDYYFVILINYFVVNLYINCFNYSHSAIEHVHLEFTKARS